MTIGERLRELRETLGLSQEQFGAKCVPPIDRAHISHYETGKQVPGTTVLPCLSAAAGLTVAEFAQGVIFPEPRPRRSRSRRAQRARFSSNT